MVNLLCLLIGFAAGAATCFIVLASRLLKMEDDDAEEEA